MKSSTPLDQSNLKKQRAKKQSTNKLEKEKIKVLIVDDSKDFAWSVYIKISAQQDMTTVGIASNGIEALEMISSKQPDIILLDLIIPYIDGFEVLNKVNAQKDLKRPAIIILSNTGSERIAQMAFTSGADYFIVKPFDMDTLVTRIRQFVHPDADINSRT